MMPYLVCRVSTVIQVSSVAMPSAYKPPSPSDKEMRRLAVVHLSAPRALIYVFSKCTWSSIPSFDKDKDSRKMAMHLDLRKRLGSFMKPGTKSGGYVRMKPLRKSKTRWHSVKIQEWVLDWKLRDWRETLPHVDWNELSDGWQQSQDATGAMRAVWRCGGCCVKCRQIVTLVLRVTYSHAGASHRPPAPPELTLTTNPS